MGATRSRGMRWRRSKSRRRRQKARKGLRPSPSEPVIREEFAEAEAIDRLLVSALRYWEVERDLIEERTAARSR